MLLTGTERHAFWSIGLVGGSALLLAACGIQLGALGPEIDIVQSDGTIGYYRPNQCASTVLTKSIKRHERIAYFVSNPGGNLPQDIAQNSFVNKLIKLAHHASSRGVYAAQVLAKDPTAAPTAASPPPEITPSEFFEFGKLAVQFMHRVTAAPDSEAAVQRALRNLKLYYAIYFQGKFQTYLGAPLAAPSVIGTSTTGSGSSIVIGGSSTISDDQIVPAVQVFIEYLFDEILQSTVWVTYSNNKISAYYPGGSGTQPTYLLVNSDLAGQIEQTIGPGPTGCGMNVFKLGLMTSVINQSATIASGETGLLVKSAGGIELGLGVLGKLSVGDNNLVAEVAKNVATVVASRLTVLIEAPILDAVDYKQQSPQIAAAAHQLAGKISRSGKVSGTSSSALVNTRNLQALTAPLLGETPAILSNR